MIAMSATEIIAIVLQAVVIFLLGYQAGKTARLGDNKPTFYTHSIRPYEVGQEVQYYGEIIRIERVENTRLNNGGWAPCWAVYCEPHEKTP